MYYIDFFSNLGFDFNEDLEPKSLVIEKNSQLTQKLNNSVFFYKYKKNNNNNTSFYLITTTLSSEELEEVRKFIWNKNDADLIFYYPNENARIDMFYAKYSPKITNESSRVDYFNKDEAKIEKIKRWNFDSGAFWLNYSSFFRKAKYKGIDEELVSTLNTLKELLNNNLSNLVSEEDERNVIVQALIDRTLYIKYLEDNHIINSYFYKHYFNDESLSYEKLLGYGSNTDINILFGIIHEIFNNALFDQPTIDSKYLTNNICNLIATSFKANLNTGQLNLFDFQFDILPVEFISYIYEIFLTKEQKDNGIYFTPKKLAQLIVDEVINEDKIGSILDPSCGSGMFLIVGYQRLLEIAQKQRLEPVNNLDKIKFRIQLLSDNIFGIEKQETAKRFTLFSLSLQIFKNIPANEIKSFIANELEKNNKIELFTEFDFYKNIIHQNTLDLVNTPFKGKIFNYVVGNPPFVRKEVSQEAKDFTNYYEINHLGKNFVAKNIIDGYQISQCFLLKIKEWSNTETRFGFISNSSNFYNEALKFQDFFYSNYGIEKLYELSRVKEILFKKPQESVVAIIFNNKCTNRKIEYYPVDLGLFSEKPFELLIIQEDNVIEIEQQKLINQDLKLRDYLVGNKYDRFLVSKIGANSQLKDYYCLIGRGFQIWGEAARKKEFNLSKSDWSKLDKIDQEEYLQKFVNKYFSNTSTSEFNKPYIKPVHLRPFKKLISTQFINSIDNFERPIENKEIYLGKKLIFTRIGSKLNCVYLQDNDYFDFSIYTIKLKDDNLYYLFQALLNSQLIQFYLDFYLRKRVFDSFSRIGNDDILKIPIPRDLDQDFANEISKISQAITEEKFDYSEKEEDLNELIYDLYELSYLERQRIKDYFIPDANKKTTKSIIKNYIEALKETIKFYFLKPIEIEEYSKYLNLMVIKIQFEKGDNPSARKVGLYTLEKIFKENPHQNFMLEQEFLFGKDCVYILKKDIVQNWTESKAFEDGRNILKFTLNDRERVYQNG